MILFFKLLTGFYKLLNLKFRGASYSLFNKQAWIEENNKPKVSGYPTPHLVNFNNLLEEEKRQLRNKGYAASAPSPNDEELQALVEEELNSSASAQAPPVAAQRTMSPPTVPKNIDKGGNVNEPTAQNAVVVGMKPPHPRNWLENMYVWMEKLSSIIYL